MPRLPPQLLRQADSIHPFLPLLLRSCRHLPSAHNELRWLRDHLASTTCTRPDSRSLRKSLHRLCLERSRGRPLQYVIGDQPFGELEILCKPGVLIPRPETEMWTIHLADHVLSKCSTIAKPRDTPLRILDLCTGTGCISLLLHALLHRSHSSLEILGVDLFPTAIRLARQNLHHNVSKRLLSPSTSSQIRFEEADIFKSEGIWQKRGGGGWDIVVSNPPYISPEEYNRTTTRSVRNWEPKTALVPPPPSTSFTAGENNDASIGDRFYPSILDIAASSGAKIVAMEVSDIAQAQRVAGLVLQRREWARCEIWRDGLSTLQGIYETQIINGQEVGVRGHGNGRVVVGWR